MSSRSTGSPPATEARGDATVARLLTPDQIAERKQIDTATMTNAIEHYNVQPPTSGFASLELQCLIPNLPPIVGYAVTVVGDSSTLAISGPKSQNRALIKSI